jgi:hypothetical protein
LLLERESGRFIQSGGAFERLAERRDRKRRNQRITAGVVGIAVFVAAVWIVTTGGPFDRTQPADLGPTVPPSTRVGFIGLSPEGAAPSTPARGELVLSLAGRSASPEDSLDQIWVYADGRVIWRREGNLPEGANKLTTGFLEQHLTPEGVESVRSEIVSTGMFRDDLVLVGDRGPIWDTIKVRNGDRLVRVDWVRSDFGYPEEDDATIATPEQTRALERVDALLTDPASWLPTSAWDDQEIRAYVPSTYAVCYSGVDGRIEPSRILSVLPAQAEVLLRDIRTRDPYCSEVTTDEARALAEIFDDAAFEQDERENPHRLNYHFEPSVPLAPGPIENTVDIFFEPYLPHGKTHCLQCG